MGEHYCRVCGLYCDDKPWGEDGNCPLFEYCSCCGVEFGYQDYTVESTKEFRKKWIANGAKWSELREKPEDWDLNKQMQNIPDKYK